MKAGETTLSKFFTNLDKFIERRHERKIVWGLIGGGLLIMTTGITSSNWVSIIAHISDYLFNTQFNIPAEPIDYIRLCFAFVGGLLLIGAGTWFELNVRKKRVKHTFLQILHSSIETVSYSKINKNFSDYEIERFHLNQSKELIAISESNLQHALREQEKFVQKALNRIDGKSDIDIGYFGLAHIPLVFLLGFQMADKFRPTFFEWNQNDLIWEEIKKKNVDYPKLLLTKNEEKQQIDKTTDIVIK